MHERIIALAWVLACSRSTAKPDAAPPPSATQSASVMDAAAEDAGRADIELIWGVGLSVGMSSMVDNHRDLPSHIADHDAGTAWNGATGDLVGGWFGVRLGGDKYVDYVTFTVGFDKKTDAEDLFTANHRITRVRVDCIPPGISQSTKTLREVDVDPEVRTPQRVLVDAFCWDLKLVVTGVKPGTHAGWRELAVSEFAVYGWEKPPDPREAPYHRAPSFGVGPDYSKPKSASLYRGTTYDEGCAKLIADEDEKIRQSVRCSAPKSAESGRGAMLEWGRLPYSYVGFHGELAAFKTADGVFVAYATVSGRESDDVSHTDYRLQSQTWSGDALVLDVAHTTSISPSVTLVDHIVCHPAHDPWCTITWTRHED